MAKLWGIFWGLCVCYNMGVRNIVVETDSRCAFQMISTRVPESHACRTLVQAIGNLWEKIWHIEVCLIYREANMCADSLAKAGHRLNRGLTVFDRLPGCCHLAFLADLVGDGHGCPRFVNC